MNVGKTICLGIPHTPWRPERVAAMAKLRATLGLVEPKEGGVPPEAFRWVRYGAKHHQFLSAHYEVTDQAPNHEWASKLWTMALETGCDFFLTLQDDAIVPPYFWPALSAMLTRLPAGAVLGLAAQHPIGVELACAGHRWYRTRSWVVGTAYGLWKEDLRAFLEWRAALPQSRRERPGEDSLLNEWVSSTARSTWHPAPTIVLHDLSLETNYAGNETHDYRQSSLTWQDCADEERHTVEQLLCDPGYWNEVEKAGDVPPLVDWPKPKPVSFDAERFVRNVENDVAKRFHRAVSDMEEAGYIAGPTFALSIAHTPWRPERVVSLRRLLEQLKINEPGKGTIDIGRLLNEHGVKALNVETDRAPNHVWSESMWRWAAETDADWCVFFNDDVEVAPTFWGALRAIIRAEPGRVIGLHVAHPAAADLAGAGASASEGATRLFTTSDGLVGPAYALPRRLLVEFLEWRSTKLKPGWQGKLHEDTMLGLWCAVTGRHVLHPIPTIVDHDVSLASTYDNDSHRNRTAAVTWRDAKRFALSWNDEDLEGAGFWQGRFNRVVHRASDGSVGGTARATSMDPRVIAQGQRIPHLGCYYDATSGAPTARTAERWVKDLTPADIARLRQDNGGREKRRLAYASRARGDWTGKHRILVLTPTRGGAHPIYTTSMVSLVNFCDGDVEHGLELLGTWQWDEDLVRVRSRMLRAALDTDCTHVHFRDADVAASPECLLGMIRAQRDLVCAPYPRRLPVDFERVAAHLRAGDSRPVEAYAYSYNALPLPGATELHIDDQGCAEVAGMPLGCSLLSREAIEHMTTHYDELDRFRLDLEVLRREWVDTGPGPNLGTIHQVLDELERWRKGHMGLRFADMHGGEIRDTVALFQLMHGPKGELMGEDVSFCARLRAIGRRVWLYLGPGSPADHAGEHVYHGRVEAFGLERMTRDQVRRAERERQTQREPNAFALDTPEDPKREPEEPAAP